MAPRPLHPLTPRTSIGPTSSALLTPCVLAPLIIGAILLTLLFAFAIYHWLRQDDAHTLQTIETKIRRRRSSTLASLLSSGLVSAPSRNEVRMGSGEDVAGLRKGIGEGVRSPSPIWEETADDMATAGEMRDVDLEASEGGRKGKGRERAASGRERESGGDEDLVKVTTWGSVIAPVNWVRRLHSQRRRERL